MFIERNAGKFQSAIANRAFSLLEMMVAVTLLLVIIGALLTMFYQTQRAFRLSATQEDILDAGRAQMELFDSELPEITPSDIAGQVNLYALTAYSLLQPRPSPAAPRLNLIQDVFFLRQHNDQWIGTGYFVSSTNDPVGTLYRFEESVYATNIALMPLLLTHFIAASQTYPPPTTNSHRLMDRVVNLKLTPSDAQGRPWTNLVDASYSVTNVQNEFAFTAFSFTNGVLPSYLNLELGILEPRAYEKYKALAEVSSPGNPRALQYLTAHVEKVHLFQQRIPIRTAQ